MCKLCKVLQNKTDILMENDTCFAVKASSPVNYGHIIVATKECKPTYFDLNYKELEDMDMLIRNSQAIISTSLSPDGYNIGFNVGEWAGQEIMHCHAHLIPRYAGDVPATELNGGIKNFKQPMRESN